MPDADHIVRLQREVLRLRRQVALLEGELEVHRRSPREPMGLDRAAPELTVREAQVLELIARGCSSREIADALYLSVNSVKTHTRNLYRKIGVSNRASAAVWALAPRAAAEPVPATS
jgi:DNA-binding NarL/FixJ family response regulator